VASRVGSDAGKENEMPTPNPIEMQKYLGGLNYPAARDDIVEHAREKGANKDVLEHLQALPDRQYDGPNAVSKEFSNT
jgi:hypothetical protein